MSKLMKNVLIIVAMYLIYMVITDPDLGILKDLPFGAEIIMLVGNVIITLVGVITGLLVRGLWFTGDDNEEKLVSKCVTPEAASRLHLSNSIRFLAVLLLFAVTLMK